MRVVALMRIRGGKLLAREHRFLENLDGEEDAVVLSVFSGRLLRPLEDRARDARSFHSTSRTASCSSSRSAGLAFAFRSAGLRRELVELAEQNARHLLEELKLASRSTSDERAGDPVYELQRELGLQKLPRTHGLLRHLDDARHRHRRRRACGSRTVAPSGPSTASSR